MLSEFFYSDSSSLSIIRAGYKSNLITSPSAQKENDTPLRLFPNPAKNSDIWIEQIPKNGKQISILNGVRQEVFNDISKGESTLKISKKSL